MKPMFLSIIIPTKNEEEHLGALLKDLRAQSFHDAEVIVADAYSMDNTREVAVRYKARVVDGGLPGEGRNMGVESARGDLFLFLDADVRLPSKHFLRDALKEMRMRQLDVMAVRVLPDSGRMVDMALHRIYNWYIRATRSFHPHAAGACLFAKRHMHEALGGFDESITLAEDVDYVKRGAKIGYFGILKLSPVYISTRRMDKEGRGTMAIKYLKAEAHLVTKGPIRNHEVPYDYDYGQKK